MATDWREYPATMRLAFRERNWRFLAWEVVSWVVVIAALCYLLSDLGSFDRDMQFDPEMYDEAH